jgi:outer membrane biosynthesis protein TonB
MEIIAEAVELQDVVVEAEAEAPAPDSPDADVPVRVRAKEPKPKAIPKPRASRAKPAPPPEPEPEPDPVPEPPTPQVLNRRKPASVPAPTASLQDVMGMLAAALADQRQTRTAQRAELYRGFLM